VDRQRGEAVAVVGRDSDLGSRAVAIVVARARHVCVAGWKKKIGFVGGVVNVCRAKLQLSLCAEQRPVVPSLQQFEMSRRHFSIGDRIGPGSRLL
jgi:hypothetical protein